MARPPGTGRHNASIYFTLTPRAAANFSQLGAGKGASKLVRALILDDLLDTAKNSANLGDIRLRMYREAVGKNWLRHAKWRIRVPAELRRMAQARCRLLGFTMTEYVVALIARHAHREGITRGGKYVRH